MNLSSWNRGSLSGVSLRGRVGNNALRVTPVYNSYEGFQRRRALSPPDNEGGCSLDYYLRSLVPSLERAIKNQAVFHPISQMYTALEGV